MTRKPPAPTPTPDHAAEDAIRIAAARIRDARGGVIRKRPSVDVK